MGNGHNHARHLLVSAPLGVALAVLLGLCARRAGAVEIPQWEIENRRCFNCHSQPQIAQMPPAGRAAMVTPATRAGAPAQDLRPGLVVTQETLAGGVHKKLACVQCHTDAKDLPHPARLAPAQCSSCHTKQESGFIQGAHAAALAKGDPKAPTCATCHGAHDITPKTNRESRIHPLNVIKTCGGCHQQHQTKPNGHDGKSFIDKYLESVHGKALAKGTLAIAATCADCHGAHEVRPSSDPKSAVNRQRVADTCGHCHTGLAEVYEKSIHGRLVAKGDKNAPVCSDCHTAHAITHTNRPAFKLDIVNQCGECHDKPRPGASRSLYDTYRMSYHGQVTNLGFDRGARCSDCHGAHDIMRIDEPGSRLNGENRVATCRQCHKEANASFAKFQPHADYRDGERYPILHGVWLYFVIMMSFAFGFFGLHSLLWFFRSLVERIRHGSSRRFAHGGASIQRFNRVDRANHALVIISFFGLTLTGLPLLYADKPWAKALAEMLGGVQQAGLLHRFFALMLIGNFAVHFVGVFRRFRKLGFKQMVFGPATMLPRWKDVTDCLGMVKWFFVGGKKPAFDRWTYWEKFDYMAEVGGSAIIGLSGLMLWFPEFFAKLMPGWMFNVATVVHGYEALLAIGFIFTIHFFNAHLRMDKFPVDDVMFTGRLPEEEFKHERGAEYERLAASGELAKLRVPPAPHSYRVMAVIGGAIAMAVGTTLAVLIILAGLGVL